MSLIIYREEKQGELQVVPDGEYIAKIIDIEVDSSNSKVYYVSFMLSTGEVIRNRYVFNPKKRDPLDILISVTLGHRSINVDLEEIIGKTVKITVANEGIYTNVKKVNQLDQEDLKELERYLNNEDTDDLDLLDDDDEPDEAIEDDEDLEPLGDPEDDNTDETENEDAEEPQSNWGYSGRSRRRRS
ncbi:hypothetical protein [Paenibacillus sp. OK003]|uniref:hypothetical protein n=1 Tax=Paenibacillus sp. OK003 TaxID=1884380 RepID=UPI0008C6D22D|nr:hypothetical protein [Paenibacillus sp. OK003]SEL78632.1 hypothetical protein SAMN05518856_11870 [Paenibacillus sp. OK003]